MAPWSTVWESLLYFTKTRLFNILRFRFAVLFLGNTFPLCSNFSYIAFSLIRYFMPTSNPSVFFLEISKQISKSIICDYFWSLFNFQQFFAISILIEQFWFVYRYQLSVWRLRCCLLPNNFEKIRGNSQIKSFAVPDIQRSQCDKHRFKKHLDLLYKYCHWRRSHSIHLSEFEKKTNVL